MWGRIIIGAVVIVLVAVWLAAIWIVVVDPRVLPWKWWMPKVMHSSSICHHDPDLLAALAAAKRSDLPDHSVPPQQTIRPKPEGNTTYRG
jgi:hypothetical protein